MMQVLAQSRALRDARPHSRGEQISARGFREAEGSSEDSVDDDHPPVFCFPSFSELADGTEISTSRGETFIVQDAFLDFVNIVPSNKGRAVPGGTVTEVHRDEYHSFMCASREFAPTPDSHANLPLPFNNAIII